METSDDVPIQDTITTSVAIDSNLEVLFPSQNSPTQIVIKQTNPLPKRTRHIPSYFDGYVYQLSEVDKLSQPRTNLVSSGTLYPISCHLSYSHFVPSHQVFLANISMVSEPKSFSQTVKEPKWCEAMKQEIYALELNHTWSLVPLPSRKKLVGSRWVYKIKYMSDGFVERCKACLV